MSFQVYEQGRGIATPWYDVFPARHVGKPEGTQGPLSLSDRDQLKEGGQPTYSQSRSRSAVFKKVEQDSQERFPVFNAGQIMSKNVHTVPLTLPVKELWREFDRYRFRHFPVVDTAGILVGIVSERDALIATSALTQTSSLQALEHFNSATVADIMKQKVLTATPETNLRELSEVMILHHVGAMPLMGASGELLGIVTRTDILRTLTHQVPVSLWT